MEAADGDVQATRRKFEAFVESLSPIERAIFANAHDAAMADDVTGYASDPLCQLQPQALMDPMPKLMDSLSGVLKTMTNSSTTVTSNVK